MNSWRTGRLLTLSICIVLIWGGHAGSQEPQQAEVLLQAALNKQVVEGDLEEAIRMYEDIVARFASNRPIAAKALVQMGRCYEKLGNEKAREAYERVVREYADQSESVADARARLALLEQALSHPEEQGPTFRQIWADTPDAFFVGAPSPDGRYLSYVDWEGFGNLGVRDLVTGENRLLTNIDSWDAGEMAYHSVFSPDSRQLVYTWQNKEGNGELRIIGIEGGATRVLYTGVGWPFPASWSSDGKHILAWLNQPETVDIVLVTVEDGSVRKLKSPPTSPGFESMRMSLSPDGQYIAYNYAPREDSENQDIFLLAADGSRQIPLVEHPADDVVLGWEPGGKRVLFKSDRTGSADIWDIQVVGGKPQGDSRLVRPAMGNIFPLGLTPEGALYYGLHSGWSDIFTAELDPETGEVLSEPVKAVEQYEGYNSAPDWSPDGQYLVCRSSKGEGVGWGAALLIRSSLTEEIRELIPKRVGGLNFHFLRWSPDGHSVLGVGSDEKGQYGALWAIDVQTGDAEIIARPDDPNGAIFQPNWSPDGRAVFYSQRFGGARRIIRHEIETGVKEELLSYSPSSAISDIIRHLTLSPDGKQLAFLADDTVKLISATGGEPRELIQVNDVHTIAWTRDGRYILYGKTGEDSKDMVELWRISANGGESQKLELAMSNLMHLRVHPDGRRIAFTASQQPAKSEVWVMENFLPPLEENQ